MSFSNTLYSIMLGHIPSRFIVLQDTTHVQDIVYYIYIYIYIFFFTRREKSLTMRPWAVVLTGNSRLRAGAPRQHGSG